MPAKCLKSCPSIGTWKKYLLERHFAILKHKRRLHLDGKKANFVLGLHYWQTLVHFTGKRGHCLCQCVNAFDGWSFAPFSWLATSYLCPPFLDLFLYSGYAADNNISHCTALIAKFIMSKVCKLLLEYMKWKQCNPTNLNHFRAMTGSFSPNCRHLVPDIIYSWQVEVCHIKVS